MENESTQHQRRHTLSARKLQNKRPKNTQLLEMPKQSQDEKEQHQKRTARRGGGQERGRRKIDGVDGSQSQRRRSTSLTPKNWSPCRRERASRARSAVAGSLQRRQRQPQQQLASREREGEKERKKAEKNERKRLVYR